MPMPLSDEDLINFMSYLNTASYGNSDPTILSSLSQNPMVQRRIDPHALQVLLGIARSVSGIPGRPDEYAPSVINRAAIRNYGSYKQPMATSPVSPGSPQLPGKRRSQRTA